MRLSRPCYDKYHRCPGWAGGGIKYARRTRCAGGSLDYVHQEAHTWSRWRFYRHRVCGVVVLPYVTRWLSPWWLAYEIKWSWQSRHD